MRADEEMKWPGEREHGAAFGVWFALGAFILASAAGLVPS